MKDNIRGELLINGEKITERNRTGMRNLAGYVAQDDVIMAELTVEENIMFSANCRLPTKWSHEDKLRKVNELIEQLRLKRCRNCLIGNEMIRGVSGGERKRCAIAMELVTDPSLLFLDEPTTGLDSTTAFKVIELCKQLSAKQTTILSIHGFYIWDALDSTLKSRK